MTDSEDTAPLQVDPNPVPGQLGQALRVLLVAIGGWLVGKGWIDANVAGAAIPVVLIGGPLIWGQLRTYARHGERVTLADAAPDSVATVKQS